MEPAIRLQFPLNLIVRSYLPFEIGLKTSKFFDLKVKMDTHCWYVLLKALLFNVTAVSIV